MYICFFHLTVLHSNKCVVYIIVLICNSQMTKIVEDLFLCLAALCISTLTRSLFRSLLIFKLLLFSFCRILRVLLYFGNKTFIHVFCKYFLSDVLISTPGLYATLQPWKLASGPECLHLGLNADEWYGPAALCLLCFCPKRSHCFSSLP